VKKQHIVALLILVVVGAWMVVPKPASSISEDALATPASVTVMPEGQAPDESSGAFTVRAATISAQTYVEQVRVRGRTQAFRHVQVRAEQAGRIVGNPIQRGARVNTGDVLCEIAIDSRESDLQEAVSRREQARFEYEAGLDLQERGLQSDVAVAQMKAALDSAIAGVSRATLALEKTKIVSPFDGIVEFRTVEVGDLLDRGGVCASVLDDSPMLLVGLVPEQDISKVKLDAAVTAQLLTGSQLKGVVTYLSRTAETTSRSYRIEVELDPSHQDIRVGITAEILVKAAEISAHLIPSSALTLDDEGVIGVKLVDPNNKILFRNIEIVGDNTSQLNPGVWVTGLNDTINLVTVGQEIVFPGQTVISDFSWSNQQHALRTNK
jgi:multidrug efflux system membrane fusion protein